MSTKKILIDLQSYGARIEVPVDNKGRRGGAGPSDSKAFILAGVAAMVPTLGQFAQQSPYAVTPDDDGGYCLTRNGEKLMQIEFPSTPHFYSMKTDDGIPYQQIAVLHGSDVLATTVSQRCVRWRRDGERCLFCGIENSLESGNTIALKTPEMLAEVAEAAVRYDGIKHFIMTTGTMNYNDMGVLYLAKCALAVKAVVDIGIQVQFEPPENLDDMLVLKEAGVDSVGIHLESFDQETRNRLTPGKATISVERHFEAYEKAVELFGRNQVSTYIIVGLGDSEETIIEGCERLARIGVYPFIVPLRPIIGTTLENSPAPDPALMDRIYRQVAANNLKHGLSWRNSKAGCSRCGACSGLKVYE